MMGLGINRGKLTYHHFLEALNLSLAALAQTRLLWLRRRIMFKKPLMPLASGYLQSAGLKIVFQSDEVLVADRLIFGQDRETWIVLTVPPDESPESYESSLRANVSRLIPKYPSARAYVLTHSRVGFSRELQQTLSDNRIWIRTPVQFFDASFKVEEAPKAASIIADLRSLDIDTQRIEQPYTIRGAGGSSPDLFESLAGELTGSDKPAVRVVVGRAGIGKSFLFKALFARLYDGFLDMKAKQATRPRPIPLVPEYLKGLFATRTELLVENFLRTDVAAPVSRETFEWLLVNGFAIWLLDGLDELYAGDPDFFDYLVDLVTRPNSQAQITIFCRDSLLTTSHAFADFQETCTGSPVLKIYHLLEWERPTKRRFAWSRLEKRLPRADEDDTSQVGSFLKQIDLSKTMRILSGLPFYCEIMVQQYQEANLREFNTDVDMLNYVVDQMIEREKNKGLLDLRFFEARGLDDWLEQIAISYLESQRYAGIDRDEALTYGELVLQDGLDIATKNHILTSLLQFPLFRAGARTGLVAFAHDLIAEVLAARRYLRELSKQPGDVGLRLSRTDLDDPTILRFIAHNITAQEEAAITRTLQSGDVEARCFAVLLSLLMLALPDYDLIREGKFNLEGRDLSGVRFKKRDLTDVSFRRADLSHCAFVDCNLSGALFEGAFFSQTHFEGNNNLGNAQFGDCSRLQSIMVGRKLLDDPGSLRDWVSANAGLRETVGESCPTALQVMALFAKYISPLGESRRDELPEVALAAGRRYGGAASTEDCVEEAKRHGYILGPDFRGRYRRAAGDAYREMVEFVRDGRVSDKLGQMIARLCRRRGCLHQVAG